MEKRKVACLCMLVTVMAMGLASVYRVGATDGATIRISGTGGDDTITVDEDSGKILLNGVRVEPTGYVGGLGYTYEINGGKGDDVIHIFDGSGNSIYFVYAGQGDDYVTITDRPGNDVYLVETGQGNDDVYIEDGLGSDHYTVILGKGSDGLIVWDDYGGPTKDYYTFDGGQDVDSLTLHGLVKGPPPSEGEGGTISIVGFENIT